MIGLQKFGIAVAMIFSVNLIFGLPVDSTNSASAEVSAENSTNNTHKEFQFRTNKNVTLNDLIQKYEIPELLKANLSDDMTIAEYVQEEDQIVNVTETEYDYYDGNDTTNFTSSTLDNSTSYETNKTIKEVYVIKATTYEIGILADVPNDDNTTDNGPVTRQQVDLTFYDTQSNDSFINFGTVPLPVQTTGVKGQVITGIAPVNIGAVDSVDDVLKALPFSGTIVNITQSDTSFVHLNRENLTENENQVQFDNPNIDLAQLPILNNVLLPNNFNEAYETVN